VWPKPLQISFAHWSQRRYDNAIEWTNKTLELDPRHQHAREHLAGVYWKKGDGDCYVRRSSRTGSYTWVYISLFHVSRSWESSFLCIRSTSIMASLIHQEREADFPPTLRSTYGGTILRHPEHEASEASPGYVFRLLPWFPDRI